VFEGGNAVRIVDWCRKLNSKVVCLDEGSPFDPSVVLQDQLTEIDLRSTTGRFIFYPQGSVAGFRLYDLLTMRNVTPPGAELVASTHWADFSADDKRLFLTMSGRLLVFEPRADGGPWQRVSDGGSVQIPALTGNKDDRVSGLLTLDDNTLIVVRSSGVISRFDWRTGQESWRRTITNAGELMRAVPSRNRRFVLIIGRGGGRLLDTNDGLVLSGVLVPPAAGDGSTDMLECFRESFVSDSGVVDVSCGKNEYRREQVAFQGDVRSRLRQILSSESPAGQK
jgi:outer membrane protein assembly factor BamB